MDFRQIEGFLCLYQFGSMTRAAAELGIVQSALSTQIAKLEKDLKVQLFERSSRGVRPTVAGADLYKMLLPLSKEVESVRQRMHDLGGSVSGVIRLGVVPSLGQSIVPRTLQAYCASHGDVRLRLTEAYSMVLIDELEAGELDVVVVNRVPSTRALHTEPLVSEELVLVLAADSPLAATAGKGLADLSRIPHEKLIVPTAGQGLRVLIDACLEKRGLPTLRPGLEMNALTPTLELVKTGQWATILPISAISHEIEAGLLRIRRIDRDMRRELVAASHPRRPISLAARQLLELLTRESGRAADIAARELKRVS